MPLEILTGKDVPTLLARAQRALGEDAVVLAVRRIREDGRPGFEMTVADARTAQQQKRLAYASQRGADAVLAADRPAPSMWTIESAAPSPARAIASPRSYFEPAVASYSPPPPRPVAEPRPSRGFALPRWPGSGSKERTPKRRPRVIALVGPTGAGKTTTCPKLVHSTVGFAGQKVGFLNLDTFRVGAVEQSKHWAELARVPIETVWDRPEIQRAMNRLRDRDVILVDTPGRGPRATADLGEVHARLLELATDEVHLVLPAGLQTQVVRRVLTTYLPLGVTHLLPTKLDEFPEERAIFEAAAQFGLPMRWLTDGQEVPADLHAAPMSGAAAALQGGFA